MRAFSGRPIRNSRCWSGWSCPLKHVTFQKDLGSYYDKTQRVQRLCSWLSEILKQSGITVRPGVIHKAACLAKTDLTTELVKEFTELQELWVGCTRGRNNWIRRCPKQRAGPSPTRFTITTSPSRPKTMFRGRSRARCSPLADKADTIAGMFALGLVPSGSKDPFALRRQANGVVKIIAEKKLPLRLSELMSDARAGYQGSEAEKKFVDAAQYSQNGPPFFRERLEFYLKGCPRIHLRRGESRAGSGRGRRGRCASGGRRQ